MHYCVLRVSALPFRFLLPRHFLSPGADINSQFFVYFPIKSFPCFRASALHIRHIGKNRKPFRILNLKLPPLSKMFRGKYTYYRNWKGLRREVSLLKIIIYLRSLVSETSFVITDNFEKRMIFLSNFDHSDVTVRKQLYLIIQNYDNVIADVIKKHLFARLAQ